ncbi:hypothetical protein [Leifsonia sp. EB34]|uniref:hypothetical protein n=1 Tax=Leifsonia sp. EB34 TaxID=3156303 RepID=UPI003514A29B
MHSEIDGTVLELEASSGELRASVDKNGYDGASLDVIARYVDAHETDAGLVVVYALADGEVSFGMRSLGPRPGWNGCRWLRNSWPASATATASECR